MLFIHILAGIAALASGAIALAAAKGGGLHRRSGRLFVYAMVTMAFGGAVIALARGAAPAINVPAGLTTIYLVVTALTTVRPRSATLHALDRGAMIFGFLVGLACIISGIVTLATARGPAKGMAYPLFMFGMIGLGGAKSDRRMLRNDGLRGAHRLRRHLWRMCAALLIATGSFFLGQAQVFPAPIRDSGLLPVPVFAVLAAMLYWLWRVRARGTMNSGRLEGHQPSGVRSS
jgi:uncharacterized membrane protein